MLKLLENQTAIITGGTAGIGREIAFKFADHGARVAIFGMSRERGEKIATQLKERTGYGAFYEVNVTKKNEVASGTQDVIDTFGEVTILVNNAGITRDQLLIKMGEQDWDEVMTTNVKSCYHTVKAVARCMMKAKKGKIINMSSVVGLKGNPGQVNYAASKAAVIGMTKALARELATRGICVNCIAPGFIDTKMTEALSEVQKNQTLSQIPFRRMGTPKDVANGALFLASSLSDYITGQVLIIDGGMSI